MISTLLWHVLYTSTVYNSTSVMHAYLEERKFKSTHKILLIIMPYIRPLSTKEAVWSPTVKQVI